MEEPSEETFVEGYTLVTVRGFLQADICTVAEHPGMVVVRALSPYIPLLMFQIIFAAVEDIAQKGAFTTVVFDKRKLMVFHQPSMEWYFLEWKGGMTAYGVTRHRKLLPKDAAFREAARLGREALYQNHPDNKFQQLDIRYAESLKEALES